MKTHIQQLLPIILVVVIYMAAMIVLIGNREPVKSELCRYQESSTPYYQLNLF